MDREKADAVIKGGRLVNVNTGEVQPDVDVAVKAGRVIIIGNASHTIGEETQIIDGSGYYLVPGLLDGHMHIESSMITVTQFARAVVRNGTTGVFVDPHEIANVLGLAGVRLMLDESRNLPLKVYVGAPSCVPALPGLEDAGAVIGPAEIREMMRWDGVLFLGEMMNFPGVLAGEPSVHGELQATLEADRVITGHYAVPEIELGLQAYAAAGISSCHESTRAADVLARLRLGMYPMMREGSAWRDLKATLKAITERRIDTRHAMIVSDDTHPHTLIELGHLNHIVRRAIEEGINPITAIQMATINVAEYYRVNHDLGSISPAKCADIIFVKDLTQMQVDKVMVDGVIVAEGGRVLYDLPAFDYPEFAQRSVHLKAPLEAENFLIRAPSKDGSVTVRVMEVIEAQVGTRHLQVTMPLRSGLISAAVEKDIAKVACVERHKGSGTIGLGFVKGLGFKGGAVASTVAHDSHNLLIVGMNDVDMAIAANKLAECGGGSIVVRDGQVSALVPLPIAGLVSDRPVEEVDQKIRELEQAWKELGCHMVSPFMTVALLSLPVLPELRLTNRGLVDTLTFQPVDLIVTA
ncbi:MAG: adenine deaminase [Chloroflexi bacterium]|nr:adenine deaminase [Chloroflexota bacterium]